MSEHRGGCHCGNLRLSLRLSQAPADTRLRACGCSFCRAHNTRTTSDPNGSVDIHAADWSIVERYRFGTGTAEFLICRRWAFISARSARPLWGPAPSSTLIAWTTGLPSRSNPFRSITTARRPATGWPDAPPVGHRRRFARSNAKVGTAPSAPSCRIQCSVASKAGSSPAFSAAIKWSRTASAARTAASSGWA